MNPNDLEWGEPPPQLPHNRIQLFVGMLQERPGIWAKYPHPLSRETAKRYAYNAKRYPGTEWTRRGGTLYARWIGDQ